MEDNPNMNTKPDARAGLTNARATIQTLLLIVISFVGRWLALYSRGKRLQTHASWPQLLRASSSLAYG
jgi:hypothetical protein